MIDFNNRNIELFYSIQNYIKDNYNVGFGGGCVGNFMITTYCFLDKNIKNEFHLSIAEDYSVIQISVGRKYFNINSIDDIEKAMDFIINKKRR